MLTKITFAEFIQIETFAAGFAFATVYNRVKFYLVKNFIRFSQTKQKKWFCIVFTPFIGSLLIPILVIIFFRCGILLLQCRYDSRNFYVVHQS